MAVKTQYHSLASCSEPRVNILHAQKIQYVLYQPHLKFSTDQVSMNMASNVKNYQPAPKQHFLVLAAIYGIRFGGRLLKTIRRFNSVHEETIIKLT